MKGAGVLVILLSVGQNIYEVQGQCQNGGTDIGGYCSCLRGYSGDKCEIQLLPIIDCNDSDSCENGQPCMNDAEGDYCQCSSPYSGRQCEINFDKDCNEMPCKNGGTCEIDAEDWQCLCPYGFTGIYCGATIDFDCAVEKCENEGVCIKPKPSYSSCDCEMGYTGKTCDMNSNTNQEDGDESDGVSTIYLSGTLLLVTLTLLLSSWKY